MHLRDVHREVADSDLVQPFVSTFGMSWLLDCNCYKLESVSHVHQSVQPVQFTSCPSQI